MDNLAEISASVWEFIFGNMVWWNLLFSIIIVFFERRNPKSVWAWLLLMYFIPVVGFVLYLFLGLNIHNRKMFRIKAIEDGLSRAVRSQEQQLRTADEQQVDGAISNYMDLVMYNLETSDAVLTDDNEVEIFTEGSAKFESLVKDLEAAEHFIHLEYYIIKNDVLFNRIREVLVRKVQQGVKVRILFDSMGCRSIRKEYWKKMRAQGIMTAEFFPAFFGIFQLRMNYRNHRKIAVIDNKVAYVGGFNIGREYVGLDDKFGHWRDTHLRLRGSAVHALGLRFIMDWKYAAKEDLLESLMPQKGEKATGDVPRIPESDHMEGCDIQIISSGPDNNTEQIRDNYLRLINKAQKSIYIQTPYFIPDEEILTALKIAVRSGIEVHIMIPCKPDHMFVYWATYSYIGELVMHGANCYTYDNGFLHSKGMIVDGKVFCYGTANMDIRSFALNFEVNAVVYDEAKAGEMEQIFRKDLEQCTKITRDNYVSRKLIIRIKEQICRLFSPFL
ncbi:MAG: cardiolipin synthase [Lachnospiraceae bacterium]|nr:cardiolipin synthase [Lachnospiraceae bacterium]